MILFQKLTSKWAIFYILCFPSLISSCSSSDGEEVSPPEIPSILVSAEPVLDVSANNLKGLVNFIGFGNLADFIENDISLFDITYRTMYKGKEIIASGVVAIPQNLNQSLPLMLASRGTIFRSDEAPSTAPILYGYELFAAAGYITVLPDLIGFGSTESEVQTYYDFEHSVENSIDMIQATKELLSTEGINFNEQLFLFGYSQGGYISMAIHKQLESDPSTDLRVTANAIGAGGYNLPEVGKTILSKDNYPAPAFMANLIHSYITTNDLNVSLESVFAAEFASQIPQLLDGRFTFNEINNQLTENALDLYNPDFRNGIINGTESVFSPLLRENSVHDWTPTAPLFMYHSTDDEFVPPSDSEATFELLKNNNRISDIQFKTTAGKSHSTAVSDMIELVIPWFTELRQNM